MIRIALPNKGRLADSARDLLDRAGLEFDTRAERALQAALGHDFVGLFVRARDIPEFVADGAADVGITGTDLLVEAERELEVLLDLGFGRCRLVVAAKDDVTLDDPAQLAPGTRVATSFPRAAARYFRDLGVEVIIVPVSGAAEIAPHLGVADVIVDLVSTGSTLKTNGLKEVATILESTAQLVTRGDIMRDPGKAKDVSGLVAAVESVLRARGKRYLMANVPRAALEEVKQVLPGISGPTIVDVLDSGQHVAAHAVVDRNEVYRVIAQLKALGAEGILVTPIERLMP